MLWCEAYGDVVFCLNIVRALEPGPAFELFGDLVLCSKPITIKLNNCLENQSLENSTTV
jgi:hypothetical protein